ncbi:MAG: SMP-30/gluconolactonase/LRE family protein [Streptosporangiales bacterium]|nr:SMP-30/gluconolactonase/LRE family protein [Streptosporangiales bacterium]
MLGVEQVTEPLAEHGEGPVWDAANNVLYWVDMLAGDILSLPAGGVVARAHVSKVAAVVRPRRQGGLVVAVENGFAVIDPGQREPRIVAEVFHDPAIRMNEGGCDPQGRFYCGSMAYDRTPGLGTVYRLDPDGSVHVVLEDVTISNGLAWSLDGGTVYYVDTPTRRIDAFDFDAATGTFANRRPAVHVEDTDGRPDGMTIDAEGCLWVALFGGSAVRRYTPDGKVDTVIELPVSQVTACTFGGPGLDELYITTSRQGLPPGVQPDAGALFRARPGVRGVPALDFAG